MESFIHADIFFFVATIGLVVLTTLLVAIGWYLLHILKDVKVVTTRLKESAEHVGDAIDTVATDVAHDGIIATLTRAFHRERKKRS